MLSKYKDLIYEEWLFTIYIRGLERPTGLGVWMSKSRAAQLLSAWGLHALRPHTACIAYHARWAPPGARGPATLHCAMTYVPSLHWTALCGGPSFFSPVAEFRQNSEGRREGKSEYPFHFLGFPWCPLAVGSVSYRLPHAASLPRLGPGSWNWRRQWQQLESKGERSTQTGSPQAVI